MVKLIGNLSRFSPARVLVIGDFMLDTYTTGKVKRISPEAPVSVLHVQKEEKKPGGAGNVVLNLTTLGAKVIAVGRVGIDEAGSAILLELAKENVDVRGLFCEKGYKTPVKNRLIADSQQVLRVDNETIVSLTEELEQAVVEKLPELLEGAEIIAVSDYGKGFLSRSLLMALFEMAKARNIPVIVDPKGEDFSKYHGATVLKPNLGEAYAAAKLPLNASLELVANKVLQSCSADLLLITRSEQGMSLFSRAGERFDFPVQSREVKDVTGAGDTVLAMISMALANGLDIKGAAQLANIAAGIAIEKLGCARIHLADLATRLLEYDTENKIFDEEHLFALQQAVKGRPFVVLGLESSYGMSTAVFRSIRTLAEKENEKLVVYIRDSAPDEEFVSLLSSLAEVDFIVLKCEGMKNLCELVQPNAVYSIEKGTLVPLDHHVALFK